MIKTHLIDDGDVRSPMTTLVFVSEDAAHLYMSEEFGEEMSYIFDDDLQRELSMTDELDAAPGCF